MEGCLLETSKISKKRLAGLIERVCLPIEFSDPGRILSLLRSLFENSADTHQIKINKYLAEVTGSVAVFQVLSFLRKNQYKVTVIADKILPLDLYLSGDSEMVTALVGTEKDVVEVSKERVVGKLKDSLEKYFADLEKETTEVVELDSLLAVPIKHPVSAKTLLHVVLVNTPRIVDYRRINSNLVKECMRYCMGMLVNAVCFEEEKKEHERARNFIDIMKQTLLNIEDTTDMVSELRVRICDLMGAEWCNVFLRNECGGFVTKVLHYGEHTEFAEEPYSDLKLPEDYGLVGIVAQTGEVIICDDAQSDPRFCLDLDQQFGYTTRNVLCFPLKRDKEVVGAVEVYNKVATKENDGFTVGDESAAQALGVLLTPLIFHSLNFRKISQNCQRKTATDLIYLQKTPPSDDDMDQVLNCGVVHDYHEQLHLGFSHFNLWPDVHLGCLIYDYFNKLGLITRYQMLPEVLVRFILSVLKDHPQFPHHNWRLTFSSFNFAAVLVNQLNLVDEGICTHIEMLALLLAALCHVADYRGAVSVFQVSCGTTLGALYSTPAHINQQFQSTQIFRLLERPDTNILEGLPADQFAVFARLFKKLINVADMGCYMERWSRIQESLKEVLDKNNLDQRINLLSLMMAASVLSDYSKDFLHCRKTAETSYAEFLPDVDRTAAEGVFDLTQFARNMELIPPLQIQFMSTICVPTFRLLSELFPVTYSCYDRCLKNLKLWEKYREKFRELYEIEQAGIIIQEAQVEQE